MTARGGRPSPIPWCTHGAADAKSQPLTPSRANTKALCFPAYGFKYDDRDIFRVWTFFLETEEEFWHFTAQFDLPLDTWTHLAATYDGETVNVYLDGALAKEKSRRRLACPAATNSGRVGGGQLHPPEEVLKAHIGTEVI
jgi:hypothetical protein